MVQIKPMKSVKPTRQNLKKQKSKTISENPRILRIHFNKYAEKQDGKVWSIVRSDACFHAKHIIFKGKFETEENPDKIANPRYFIKCRGTMIWDGDIVTIKGY